MSAKALSHGSLRLSKGRDTKTGVGQANSKKATKHWAVVAKKKIALAHSKAMDNWKEPSYYANSHVSGGKKKRDAITPHLRKAGLYRDKHTGKVMHQVKDRLIEAEDHSSTLSGNDN